MRIEHLPEVSSTNDFIVRYLPAGEDVIVCADRQTGGKGTKGRSFLSERGGVYMSALRFYRDLPAAEAFRIMAHAAVAVCRAAERFGAEPEIKWANDVLLNGKKLCGILIENGISAGKIAHSIVGIGVNVENDVSALGGIAISLRSVCPAARTDAVREVLIEEYQRESDFSEYLARVHFTGREITVREGEREYRAVARRVLADGRLEIETESGVRALSGAEISVRL